MYTKEERETVRVKCLAQEHNTMSPARLQPTPLDLEETTTNHKVTAPLFHTGGGRTTPDYLVMHKHRPTGLQDLKTEPGFRTMSFTRLQNGISLFHNDQHKDKKSFFLKSPLQQCYFKNWNRRHMKQSITTEVMKITKPTYHIGGSLW